MLRTHIPKPCSSHNAQLNYSWLLLDCYFKITYFTISLIYKMHASISDVEVYMKNDVGTAY